MDPKQVEPLLPDESHPSSPQTSPASTLIRSVKFSNEDDQINEDGNLNESINLSCNEIQSLCILDSTPPLSKLLMITPLLLVVSGLSLVTLSEYGSYGGLDPNDDRVTIIGKLIFASSSILIGIVSVIIVAPEPFYLSGILMIFSNISVPFSWLFSSLSFLGLIIIAVIYKTIRYNLKAYKCTIYAHKYKLN